MKGKKKGGLATRLARMSDEERAKYLQRKADIEEEARRRKEQLLTNFMKNKLKKEDAFSRLNVAKINQYWHQVMRNDKCDYMKKDIEYLRKWINKTISIKNNTINKLINELDWQEDLYGKNFEAHSKQIDNIIEFHGKNLQQLSDQYKNDQKLLLYIGSKERRSIEENSKNEIEYLKTIMYGQEMVFKNEMIEVKERYSSQIDESSSNYKIELQLMERSREKIICSLWKQLSKIVLSHVQQTELKRLHLTELQKLDSAASLVVAQQEQEITRQKVEIKKLQFEYDRQNLIREEHIKNLQHIVETTTGKFLRMRKDLIRDMNHDEKQLVCLSTESNGVIKHLEAICTKGTHLLVLVRACEKFESDDERNRKWLSIERFDDELKPKDRQITLPKLSKPRPKTSISKPPPMKYLRDYKSEELFKNPIEAFTISTRPVKEDSIVIEKKTLNKKPTKSQVLAQIKLLGTPLRGACDGITENKFDNLSKLEGLWLAYNKVELDCIAMKREKRHLLEENEALKQGIRSVLEASALGQSIPNTKCASAATTRRRFAFSAPLSNTTVFRFKSM
ncbi:hypothetical protein FQA39_LY03175 [Lamprigera yunnana]|nr:hypothetical protein FQA39_LY03175 [Lamprigera yunnana]